MTTDYLSLARKEPQLTAAVLVTVLGALAICGFFFFEYGLGYPPCPLCLEQRMSFYATVPLAALLWLGATHGASRKVLLLGLIVIVLIMLCNSGLAAYHAGIEWKLWTGPRDCTGPIDKFGSTTDLLKQLQKISLVRCDVAAWRFLGLSLAGYDVLLSLALAAIAAWGAKALLARRD